MQLFWLEAQLVPFRNLSTSLWKVKVIKENGMDVLIFLDLENNVFL